MTDVRLNVPLNVALLEGTFLEGTRINFFVFKAEEIDLSPEQLTEVAAKKFEGKRRDVCLHIADSNRLSCVLPMLVAVINVCAFMGIGLTVKSGSLEKPLPIVNRQLCRWDTWCPPDHIVISDNSF